MGVGEEELAAISLDCAADGEEQGSRRATLLRSSRLHQELLPRRCVSLVDFAFIALLTAHPCSFADHLKRHTANHDPEQRKNCPECGRSFTRSDVLFAHLKKHEVAEGGATKERSPSPPEPNGGAGMPALPETPGDGGLDDLYGWLLADSGPGWLDPLPDLAFNLEGDAALPFDWSILSLNTGGPSASTSNIFLPSSPPTDVTEPLRLSLCTYLLVRTLPRLK